MTRRKRKATQQESDGDKSSRLDSMRSFKASRVSQVIEDDSALLPCCTGLEIDPFSEVERNIDFIEALSCQADAAAHSHALEVRINGDLYAPKVLSTSLQWSANLEAFDTSSVSRLLSNVVGLAAKRAPRTPRTVSPPPHPNEGLVETHVDSFANECRAYGAIIDHGLNGIVTPKYFGYLLLTQAEEI